MPLDEAAADIGLSGERFRQVENEALKKCLARCEENGYRLEDLVRYL